MAERVQTPHGARVIKYLRANVGEVMHGAEVGVFRGDNARTLLDEFPRLRMYLVDLWEDQRAGFYADLRARGERCHLTGVDWREVLRQVKTLPRSVILQGESATMANFVANGSLDFVFVDDDHSYDGCLHSIRAWTPKVRRGGVVCGHDYNLDGVKKAVEDCFPDGVDVHGICWFARV